jgi:hypothetical protein
MIRCLLTETSHSSPISNLKTATETQVKEIEEAIKQMHKSESDKYSREQYFVSTDPRNDLV